MPRKILALSCVHGSSIPLHPEALKDKQRSLREGFLTPLSLRVHRALSWLRRAEAEDHDEDVRFILLWIGFNAAYAGDVEASASSSAPKVNAPVPGILLDPGEV
jgi:hypothetical protein